MFDELFRKLIRENPALLYEYILQFAQLLDINDEQTLVLLQMVRYYKSGNSFPSNSQIVEYTTMDEEQCRACILQLISKQLIAIESLEANDAISECYDYRLLIDRIALFIQRELVDVRSSEKQAVDVSIFESIEQAFGRPLAPIELETIARWLNEEQYSSDLVQEALEEAILNDVRNIRYLERILFEWQKQGVTTFEQARDARARFREEQQQSPTIDVNTPDVENDAEFFVYDWLKENK